MIIKAEYQQKIVAVNLKLTNASFHVHNVLLVHVMRFYVSTYVVPMYSELKNEK